MSDANGPTVFGLSLAPLAPNATPIEAVVVVKTLDPDGDVVLDLRFTDGLSTWDRAGMLRAAQVVTDQSLRDGFTSDD